MIENKEKNFISLVAYIHNDEKSLKSFCEIVFHVLENNFEKYELIFVNDGSSDRSVELIKKFAAINDNAIVSIVNMSIYQGVELAMNAGVDLAIGDFVFEFDSIAVDYDKQLIIDVYHQSLRGFDIVSAAPQNKVKLSSRLFYAVYNKFSGSRYDLKTERFRILSRRAINRVQALSKTISYRKAAYANCGLSLYCLFYKAPNNSKVLSNEYFHTRRETAFDSLVLFTNVAYKISIYLTIFLLCLTITGLIYAALIYFGTKSPIEGWTTTVFMISGGFSGVFMVLAIIIKYLSIIIELVLKKQKYLIESIEKLS